ncbi:hypothetical protein E3P99_03202 [Wallemia hederae]|uniref:CN hydrolase domain-containing protein n=1 Tax=Wallemia hederae TaxID=1540922 RepID=A0A4T0FKX7_9BASI|nr:hypothetical protein E3P99_03202 [Wallemia hederae]
MVLAAIFQFCARQCVRDNALQCVSAIESAAGRGAKFIFLPEASDFIASGDAYKSLSESLETGHFMSSIRDAAKLHNMWVSVGVHEAGASQGRCFNTQVLVDDKGIIASLYRKIHLFDVKNVGPGNTPVLESASTEPGDRVVDPATTPIGRVGMLTCYDMRFPEVSLMLREKDADIITYPSSFTVKTGKAHWEVLLRARAIETQCYVVAAAQAGVHTYAGRTSYGRAMVVSPWGEIVAQLSECDSDPRPYNESEELPTKASELAYFDIDLDQLVKVRAAMPMQEQRRVDVYGAR